MTLTDKKPPVNFEGSAGGSDTAQDDKHLKPKHNNDIISDSIFIKSLSYGYSLIKREEIEPVFEIWLGTNSVRDFIHRFDNFSDVVKYLLKQGYCNDYKEAIHLLNKGGCDE